MPELCGSSQLTIAIKCCSVFCILSSLFGHPSAVIFKASLYGFSSIGRACNGSRENTIYELERDCESGTDPVNKYMCTFCSLHVYREESHHLDFVSTVFLCVHKSNASIIVQCMCFLSTTYKNYIKWICD